MPATPPWTADPAGATTTTTIYPAAVSERSAPMLARGTRGATVMAVYPSAFYLRVNGFAPPGLLPVVAADGLRLPNALVLGSSPQVGWGVQPGDRVRIVDGEVRLPGATIKRARVWRPVPVQTALHQPVTQSSRSLAALASPSWVAPARTLATGALDGDALDDGVAAVVGAGPGLTPSGDDMLCGVMLVLRLTGETEAVARLWSAVRPRARYTTTVSECLLIEAAHGYAVPEVVRLATALGAGAQAVDEVSAAARAVVSIGHTSGADLLAGVVGGLAAVLARRGGHVVRELHTVDAQDFPNTPPGAAP